MNWSMATFFLLVAWILYIGTINYFDRRKRDTYLAECRETETIRREATLKQTEAICNSCLELNKLLVRAKIVEGTQP